MSGPVVDGLAQLDDALEEVGCSRKFMVRALYEWIREHDGRLQQPRFRNDRGLRRIIIEERQRAWDHIGRLAPEWVENLLEEDRRAAAYEAEQRLLFGPSWERRLETQTLRGHRPHVVIIDELSPLAPEVVARVARGSGKTATMAAALQSLNTAPPPDPLIGRVPAALVHQPGRGRRRR